MGFQRAFGAHVVPQSGAGALSFAGWSIGMFRPYPSTAGTRSLGTVDAKTTRVDTRNLHRSITDSGASEEHARTSAVTVIGHAKACPRRTRTGRHTRVSGRRQAAR